MEKILNELKSICEEYEINSVEKLINSIELSSKNKYIDIAVFGQFKAGKSSFINSLVNKKILPTSVLPATSIITKIIYGENQRITIYFNDKRKKEILDSYSIKSKKSTTDNSKTKKINKLFIITPLFILLVGTLFFFFDIGNKLNLITTIESLGRSNIPLIAAFFIGLMTAISPCPLATNITAIAYASKKIGNKKHTFLVGIIYTIGRMIVYIGIAAVIVWIGISSFSLSKKVEFGVKLVPNGKFFSTTG